jgi:hypothetical protein
MSSGDAEPDDAEPGDGAFPSAAKAPRLSARCVGGLRNSPFLHLRARTVLGLLPSAPDPARRVAMGTPCATAGLRAVAPRAARA